MTAYFFTFGSTRLAALASGALHWPERDMLVIADLHFGKSARLARRGGALLPPYETRATLARLAADLAATGAGSVVCLGDSFDDPDAAQALDPSDRAALGDLMRGRNWIWLAGNHDPDAPCLSGPHQAELALPPLTFRHIGGGAAPEISGHYHPKARLAGRGHRCFLIDEARVILPAYGAYAGGLWCDDDALASLMRPGALAILTGARTLVIPMPRKNAPAQRSS